MKWVMVAVLGVSFLMFGSAGVFAQEQFRPFTPAEDREFDACLFAAWVEDYCESAYWGLFPPASGRVRACVRANGGGKFPLEIYHRVSDEDYCRSAVQHRLR